MVKCTIVFSCFIGLQGSTFCRIFPALLATFLWILSSPFAHILPLIGAQSIAVFLAPYRERGITLRVFYTGLHGSLTPVSPLPVICMALTYSIFAETLPATSNVRLSVFVLTALAMALMPVSPAHTAVAMAPVSRRASKA